MKRLLLLLLLCAGEASAQGPYSAQIQAALRNYPWSYASDPVTCDSVVAHTIYYNTASNVLKYCNGTTWLTISDSSAAGAIISGTTPITGGGTTQVCFNDAGVIACGDSGLTYVKAADVLTAGGFAAGGALNPLAQISAVNATDAEIHTKTTSTNGTTRFGAFDSDDAVIYMAQFGSTSGFTVFGLSTANLGALYTNGAAASGLVVGTITSTPVVVGTASTARDYIYDSTKTLTAGAATNVVRVAIAQGAVAGGIFQYCVRASDATDFLTRCGDIPWAVVNKAGTETCTMGTPRDICSDTVTPGTCLISTLTAAFTCASNAADTVDIQINAAAAITETTLNVSWRLMRNYGASAAITPQ